jgi:hypothetical protein
MENDGRIRIDIWEKIEEQLIFPDCRGRLRIILGNFPATFGGFPQYPMNIKILTVLCKCKIQLWIYIKYGC